MLDFNELSVCADCLIAIAHDDYTGMDDDRAAEVQSGIGKHGWLMPGDSAQDDAFSKSPCDVCGTHLAGSRHQVWEDTRNA